MTFKSLALGTRHLKHIHLPLWSEDCIVQDPVHESFQKILEPRILLGL